MLTRISRPATYKLRNQFTRKPQEHLNNRLPCPPVPFRSAPFRPSQTKRTPERVLEQPGRFISIVQLCKVYVCWGTWLPSSRRDSSYSLLSPTR